MLAGCSGSPTRPDPPPTPAATSEGRRLQDVDYLASQLERLHPNLFFQTPRAEFERAVADVRAAAPSLPDHQFGVALMRLAALPRDAHTSAGIPLAFRRLALRFSRLAGGFYVTSAEPALATALGGRVVAIGDKGIDEALAAVAAVISHENQAWLEARAPAYLSYLEILHALGLARDTSGAELMLEDERGARFRVSVPAAAAGTAQLDLTQSAGSALPLHRQRLNQEYWFTTVDGSDTLYLQYNACRNGAEPFAAFAQRAFAALDQNPQARLVVDVRHNGGGDSSVDDPLIRGLEDRPARRARGRLFCLTSGGATGGRPNSYGNTRTFTLPNSGLPVSYSTTFFRLIEGSDPPSLFPELAVEESVADYRAGRDPLLEAAIAFRP
jgi:hypothetical protein